MLVCTVTCGACLRSAETVTNMQRWTRDDIAMEILQLYAAGEELSYSSMAEANPSLLRAASRHFGSWRSAVEFAGLSYDQIRKYRVWTPARIIARIEELHRQDVDLSWRNISEKVDPQLAAAATKPNRFGSWRAAIEAAGLDYDSIRRYRQWDEARIVASLRELAAEGVRLNSKEAQMAYISLFAAAVRRFQRWDRALEAAGLNSREIRLRAPFERRRRAHQRSLVELLDRRLARGRAAK